MKEPKVLYINRCQISLLTLKAPITTAGDDIHDYTSLPLFPSG